jgi:hypothetical protein
VSGVSEWSGIQAIHPRRGGVADECIDCDYSPSKSMFSAPLFLLFFSLKGGRRGLSYGWDGMGWDGPPF